MSVVQLWSLPANISTGEANLVVATCGIVEGTRTAQYNTTGCVMRWGRIVASQLDAHTVHITLVLEKKYNKLAYDQ